MGYYHQSTPHNPLFSKYRLNKKEHIHADCALYMVLQSLLLGSHASHTAAGRNDRGKLSTIASVFTTYRAGGDPLHIEAGGAHVLPFKDEQLSFKISTNPGQIF